MSANLSRAAAAGQADPLDRDIQPRSSRVDLAEMRAWINRAIAEAGWNQEALAAAMEKDAAYISRVLSGEKPLSASFIRELPDDIEAIVARFHAESFGLVVVTPASDDSAVQHFVGGLLTLLRQRPELPARASMAKATLPRRKAVGE